MKTAIKLVLVYFGVQIFSAFAVIIPTAIYNAAQGNAIDVVSDSTIALALFLGFILMGAYLWRNGYISTDKRTWSPVSPAYLAFTTLACLTSILIIEYLQTLMPGLPDLMKNTFNTLQSGWLGILSIAVFGPVLEELMFRGAITDVLLKKYSPIKAIVLSALVFGIFHINPAQVITATLIGLLLGWIYYKTESLIPCILIHILNNSLSVYISLRYPQAEYIRDMFTGNTYFVVLIVAVILFTGSILWMKRISTLRTHGSTEEHRVF
ncbi:MAG: CPBP family intramembrane metalloprotease [Mediterranea sp.]|jgi:membrane protease YdiL (CAAX protease family)|nr:CPBP family intramembrane metalloprotease [Mediterranea sp.]